MQPEYPEPPFPIQTARLLLRPYTTEEAALYFHAIQHSRAHLREFLQPKQEAMQTPAEAEEVICWLGEMWRRGEVFVYGIWEQPSGDFAGEVYLANVDLQRAADNLASQRVAARLGWVGEPEARIGASKSLHHIQKA